MIKPRLTANRAVFLFTVYATVLLNIGFWRNVWQTNTDWLLLLTLPIFMLAALNLIIQLLFWYKLHRIMLPILLIISAGASFAVMTQNIYFNADMIQNLLQTNVSEARAWLSWKFIAWVGLVGVLPAVLYLRFGNIHTAKWYRELAWRAASIMASLAVIGILATFAYQNYASFFRNHRGVAHLIVPSNLLGAGIKTAYNAYDASRPLQTIGLDAKRTAPAHERKHLMILVVGETTRAQNWGLNPNAPNTTPELKKIADVINYPNVTSCGTATAISVPCMFSNMTRENYNGNLARHQENVMDILQRAGLYTSWRENDGGCKGVCDRIKHINIPDSAQAGQCGSDGCLDIALLNQLEQEIQAMPHDGIIVLHTMGSHGPAYYQRYTPEFRRFTPTCDSNQIQDCSNTELQNTYNNTILYIDHILAQTIALLQRQPDIDSALWYLSDHGESLGEKGIYLHGTPYLIAPSQQTHIPMIFWASPAWYQRAQLSPSCLKQRATQAHSHDNLFHSLLGIWDIQTSEYQKNLDLFAPCRNPASTA